jgi:hypothetical protein
MSLPECTFYALSRIIQVWDGKSLFTDYLNPIIMKKIFTIALAVLFIILAMASDGLIMGQPPAPPAGHGLNGNQGAGGNAPIDGGSLLLMLAGAIYGAVKWIRSRERGKGDKGIRG